MSRPDFARTDTGGLSDADLQFLMDNFPLPGRDFKEIAEAVNQFPSTLESMLESDFVLDSLLGSRELLLRVSPFLFFNAVLRRALPAPRRSAIERKAINYVANLLCVFIHSDRMHRFQAHEQRAFVYLWEMIEEAERADPRRRFLIYSHIGNYSLYLSGLFADWIRHRHRYGRRSVDLKFYSDFGRAYFERASDHQMARAYELDDVFLHLAGAFDDYRRALHQLAPTH
ncbi:MAG: hypothetical protein P8009_07785 [Gammaproteobacteria bacterium]